MRTWDAIKDPDEVKDYGLDWSDMLPDGDTIQTSTWTVVVGTVVINSDSHDTTTTKAWLSGGTSNSKVTLKNHVVTAQGRTLEQSIGLVVRDK